MKTLKKPNKQTTKLVTAGLSALLVAGSLIFLGVNLERSRYDKPLPANQYCKQAMTAQSQQLKSVLDLQFGVTVPEGTPTLEQVKDLQVKCDENIDVYQVVTK